MTSSAQTPCLTLRVEDDDIAEETEDLILRLSVVNPTAGKVTIEPSQLTVTITDNDLGKSLYSIKQSVESLSKDSANISSVNYEQKEVGAQVHKSDLHTHTLT